jgi:MoxR-like ATPase
MRPSPLSLDDPSARLHTVLEQLGAIVLDKERALRLSLACLLARGHLLIEDVPGVGKTTLAHALASILGLHFQRIQFTSDLLPADILGVSVYDRESGGFEFHPGPVFAQVILADEVNRATPKAQSALLEAMEERQVTIEGITRELPEPFFVIATQNPAYQVGTFPLPESQLDRFLMRIELGFPSAEAERELLRGRDRRELVAELDAALEPGELARLQTSVLRVATSDALIDYVQSLLAHTRTPGRYRAGLSPRAGLGLLRAAQAWALLDGRDFALPEDVQTVLPAVVGHRLHGLREESGDAGELVHGLIEAVAIP